MVRMLIIAGEGMLGRQVYECAVAQWGSGAVTGTLRATLPTQAGFVALRDLGDVGARRALLDQLQPAVVVNCAAVLSDDDRGSDLDRVNGELPHELADDCAARGCRVVQISTDAVFSGKAGPYAEDRVPDPIDDYGRSKLAGELTQPPHLTVRTSIIGRRVDGRGLLEWTIGHRGTTVSGFANVQWSGVTAPEFARLLCAHIADGPVVSGVVHVRAEPMSKCELLGRIDRMFGLNLRIEPIEAPVVDRRLISIRDDIVLAARPLDEQLAELVTGGR